jgi:hypothetical protein
LFRPVLLFSKEGYSRHEETALPSFAEAAPQGLQSVMRPIGAFSFDPPPLMEKSVYIFKIFRERYAKIPQSP